MFFVGKAKNSEPRMHTNFFKEKQQTTKYAKERENEFFEKTKNSEPRIHTDCCKKTKTSGAVVVFPYCLFAYFPIAYLPISLLPICPGQSTWLVFASLDGYKRRKMTRETLEKSTSQAAVFDIDDTLYPERAFVRSGYNAVGEHLARQCGAVVAAFATTSDDIVVANTATTAPNQPEQLADWLWQRFLAGQTARAFDDLNDEFHLGLDSAGIAELVAVYRFHRPGISPFAGIAAVLVKLKSAGVPLGLVSDGPAKMQRNKLDALGLAGFFQAIVLTDDLGPRAGKPSLAGFELARQKLAIPHAGCAYISDNPAKDFVGPNALGWLTIQYIRPGQIYAGKQPPPTGKPKHIIDNDEKLLDLLLG